MFVSCSRNLCNRTLASLPQRNVSTRETAVGIESIFPIHLFSIQEFGISLEESSKALKPIFDALPPDMYDVRAKIIKLLLSRSLPITHGQARNFFYSGDFDHISPFYRNLDYSDKTLISKFRPWRYRAISSYKVFFTDGLPIIIRKQVPPFSQPEALIENEEAWDYRKWERIFADLPAGVERMEITRKIIIGVANKIHSFMPHIEGLEIILHHVRIVATKDQPADNSPEGIHQDGFPCIVSALVIDRKNIVGGQSIIYDEDKQTKIVTTELQPGMGLLHPDANSRWWHKVTLCNLDASQNNDNQEAYRSSIGFDIKFYE